MATLRFVLALLKTNLSASFASRGVFLLQSSLMLVNNLIFLVIWWVFFGRFKEVHGWRIEDMLALYGMVAGGVGASFVFFGGVRDLAPAIRSGGLDVYLTQPKSPLLQAVASRSRASGWGDLISGAVLLAWSGAVSPALVPAAAVGVAAGAVVFTATGIALQSLAFWLKGSDSLANEVWELLIGFSVYPEPIFQGALKLLLFTAIPAGFVGFLPAALVRHFSWPELAGVLGGALAYAVLALVVFHLGLRRYVSGSSFTLRA